MQIRFVKQYFLVTHFEKKQYFHLFGKIICIKRRCIDKGMKCSMSPYISFFFLFFLHKNKDKIDNLFIIIFF